VVEQSLIKIPQAKISRTKPKEKKGLQETKPIPAKEVESIKKENSLIMSLFKG